MSLRDADAAGVDDCCCLDESVVDEVAQSNASCLCRVLMVAMWCPSSLTISAAISATE